MIEVFRVYSSNYKRVLNEDWEYLHKRVKLCAPDFSFYDLLKCSARYSYNDVERADLQNSNHMIRMNQFLNDLILSRIKASPPMEICRY